MNKQVVCGAFFGISIFTLCSLTVSCNPSSIVTSEPLPSSSPLSQQTSDSNLRSRLKPMIVPPEMNQETELNEEADFTEEIEAIGDSESLEEGEVIGETEVTETSEIGENESLEEAHDPSLDPEIPLEEDAPQSSSGSSIEPSVSSNMVLVSGGSFPLVHGGKTITVSDFYIGKYEVTQAEYQQVMGKNPSHFQGATLPVEQVSWFDAIRYCNALSRKEGLPIAYNEATGELLDAEGRFAFSPNQFFSSYQNPVSLYYLSKIPWYDFSLDPSRIKGYRLPTNAEWEFAAKGGRFSKNYAFSGKDDPGEVSWYLGNANGQAHPVGQKLPNELGLYDMSGNVWEWMGELGYPVSEPYSRSYQTGVATNPYNTGFVYIELWADVPAYGGKTERVSEITVFGPLRRGGSWGNESKDVRIATQFLNRQDFSHNTIGFRVVRNP